MKPDRLPPALRVGERIRFDPAGQLYEVARVTPGAAYPFKVYDPPRLVPIVEKDGTTRMIRASRGPIEPGISLHSFVYRETVQSDQEVQDERDAQEDPSR